MKNKGRLVSFALFIFLLGSLGATAAKAADTPEETAKSFYAWYLKRIVANKSPRDDKATFQKSVSKRLSRWYYSPAYQEYGADYFIDAQDLDERWQVTTGKALIKGNTATVKVKLAVPKAGKNDWAKNLIVKLVKEGGAWKIDSVNNQKLTA